MQTTQPSLEKPRAERIRPEITRLPKLTISRRIFRHLILGLVRLLVKICTKTSVMGLENVPRRGPMIIVSNHLGDIDAIIGTAITPMPIDWLAKSALYDLPVIGKFFDACGVIWIHRGQPDRRALRAALQGLREGRLIGIAPEGRESLSGGLEEGTHGAAYLALKMDVPLVPYTYTGTGNTRIYRNLSQLRRSDVSVTVGHQFRIDHYSDWRRSVELGTQKIMRTLASQLPEEYRGVYKETLEIKHGY